MATYQETRIEWAVRKLGRAEEIGYFPHANRNDPPVEAIILQRWLAMPEDHRRELREAAGLLNIPLQDNLP